MGQYDTSIFNKRIYFSNEAQIMLLSALLNAEIQNNASLRQDNIMVHKSYEQLKKINK